MASDAKEQAERPLSEASEGKGKGKKGPVLFPGKGKAKGKASQEDIDTLHAACQFDDETSLRALLDRETHLDPNLRAKRGQTPLHTAAANGSARAVEMLISNRADLGLTNHWRETPLHLAAAADHAKVIEALLAVRASLEVIDSWNRTPFRVAVEQGAHAAAATLKGAGALEDVGRGVCEEGVPSRTQAEEHRALAMQCADHVRSHPVGVVPEPTVHHMFGPQRSEAGEVRARAIMPPASVSSAKRALSKLVEYPPERSAVMQLITDPSIDPAGRDAFGLSALHKFAAWDQAELIEHVMPHLSAADVNLAGGDEGFTALHQAVSMGAANAVGALLKDPRVVRDSVDRAGRTPRALADALPALAALASRFDESPPPDAVA